MVYLGIDTSAYTTSIAMTDKDGKIIFDLRQVLKVPPGETGLAQSAAFFQHVQNLPKLLEAVPKEFWRQLGAVGVSQKPRPVQDSYMPVFTAGSTVAQAIAVSQGVPFFQTSHQEGHLEAGWIRTGKDQAAQITQVCDADQFLAIHISGGTTELLEVQKQSAGKMRIELLGGTTDLHAGQFVDRVGVRLGLQFPCGKQLERLAAESAPGSDALLPSAVRGLEVSFSGVETAAARLLAQGKAKPDVARAVEGCILRTVGKLINNGIERTGIDKILIVGGVASNAYLREELKNRVNKAQLYWAEPKFSSDNATGVALLTRENLLSRQ